MNKRISLIDADSIVYIIAWNHKDSLVSLVEQACDSMVETILQKTQATHYFGTFSSSENFRHREYLVAPYKGNRPPKPEWVKEWEDVINSHLVNKWNFFVPVDLEADDVISYLSQSLEEEVIICSPDKDMKQLVGLHFDYKDLGTAEIIEVQCKEAEKTFWTQVLTGDTTDNIKGVPGLGPAKVQKLFEGITNEIDFHMTVLNAFKGYYGEYYGQLIYQQTVDAVQLMGKYHSHWKQYKVYLNSLPGLNSVPDKIEGSIPEL